MFQQTFSAGKRRSQTMISKHMPTRCSQACSSGAYSQPAPTTDGAIARPLYWKRFWCSLQTSSRKTPRHGHDTLNLGKRIQGRLFLTPCTRGTELVSVGHARRSAAIISLTTQDVLQASDHAFHTWLSNITEQGQQNAIYRSFCSSNSLINPFIFEQDCLLWRLIVNSKVFTNKLILH